MKLVIDIDDRLKNRLNTCNNEQIFEDIATFWAVEMANAIKNGKPLDISIDEATEQFKKNLESGFYIDHATSPFKGTTTDIDYGG